MHAQRKQYQLPAKWGELLLITENDGQKILSLIHTLHRLLLSHWLQTCYLIAQYFCLGLTSGGRFYSV